MELHVYDNGMIPLGVIDEIDSLIWHRRYWRCGEFKLLVPFTERHISLLQKYRLIMKRGDNEAGEIRYINIKKNSQGYEEIEVQGKFLTGWIGKRLVLNPIVTTTNTPNILRRIVSENVINPQNPARKIPNVYSFAENDPGGAAIEYASESNINALLACEAAAKAAQLGYHIFTDVRERRHCFRVYAGRDLTASQSANPPCVFAQEFDNILEQDFVNSVENLRSTAYVGGEDKKDTPQKVVEVGGAASGLERDEVFIKATGIKQTYRDDGGQQITLSDGQYSGLLLQHGASELEKYIETLSFSGRVNTHANLIYKQDYDLGDCVTCINKLWGVRVDVRITEITETYQKNLEDIEVTFGDGLPTLFDKIRQISK